MKTKNFLKYAALQPRRVNLTRQILYHCAGPCLSCPTAPNTRFQHFRAAHSSLMSTDSLKNREMLMNFYKIRGDHERSFHVTKSLAHRCSRIVLLMFSGTGTSSCYFAPKTRFPAMAKMSVLPITPHSPGSLRIFFHRSIARPQPALQTKIQARSAAGTNLLLYSARKRLVFHS